MATFGGLGGLGGRPVSYPARFGSPFSTLIDYVPDREAWEADWQRRYDEEAAKAGSGARSGSWETINSYSGSPQAFLSQVQSPDTAVRDNPNFRAFAPQARPDYVAPDNSRGGGTSATSPFYYADFKAQQDAAAVQAGRPQQRTTSDPLIEAFVGESPGYVPDFSALNAERERLMPLFENRAIQQSAYNSMRGWGQENGVIGPDYSRPGGHQVNAGQPGAPNHVPGVGMDWTEAAGLPDAQTNRTGVYNPGVTRRNNGWGLW